MVKKSKPKHIKINQYLIMDNILDNKFLLNQRKMLANKTQTKNLQASWNVHKNHWAFSYEQGIQWERQQPLTIPTKNRANISQSTYKYIDINTKNYHHSLTSWTNHLRSSHSAIPSPVCANGTSTIPPTGRSAKAWLEKKHLFTVYGTLNYKMERNLSEIHTKRSQIALHLHESSTLLCFKTTNSYWHDRLN